MFLWSQINDCCLGEALGARELYGAVTRELTDMQDRHISDLLTWKGENLDYLFRESVDKALTLKHGITSFL